MKQLGKYFQGIGRIYIDCVRAASRGLLQNPAIIAGSVVASLIFAFSLRLFGGLGFAGGLILGMLQVCLIALYYSWISDTVERDKLNFKSLWTLDFGMFSTVLSVAVVLWIVGFVLQSLTQGLDIDWVIPLARLAMVLIFNAIPEVIYIHRTESIPALVSAAEFTQRYWIEWYLPLLVIISPWLLSEPLSVLLTLSSVEPMLPPFTVVGAASGLAAGSSQIVQIAAILLGVIIANWYMLFRAQLFKSLEGQRSRR